MSRARSSRTRASLSRLPRTTTSSAAARPCAAASTAPCRASQLCGDSAAREARAGASAVGRSHAPLLLVSRIEPQRAICAVREVSRVRSRAAPAPGAAMTPRPRAPRWPGWRPRPGRQVGPRPALRSSNGDLGDVPRRCGLCLRRGCLCVLRTHRRREHGRGPAVGVDRIDEGRFHVGGLVELGQRAPGPSPRDLASASCPPPSRAVRRARAGQSPPTARRRRVAASVAASPGAPAQPSSAPSSATGSRSRRSHPAGAPLRRPPGSG